MSAGLYSGGPEGDLTTPHRRHRSVCVLQAPRPMGNGRLSKLISRREFGNRLKTSFMSRF